MTLSILGRSGVQPEEAFLEVFEVPRGLSAVQMTSDEVMAFCPVTGQPDFYTVSIHYIPNGHCVESKSLKLYLQKPMKTQAGMFVEQFAAKIADDFFDVAQPHFLRVQVIQKPRGGIEIRAEAIRETDQEVWADLPAEE